MLPPPFIDRAARINSAVEQHLANASCAFNGGPVHGVRLTAADAGAFDEVVTAARYEVATCVANFPGIAEGGALVINGQPARVAGAVVPDASGWASFPIVFEERP